MVNFDIAQDLSGVPALEAILKNKHRITGYTAPLYLEPITMSGERFTTMVAAISQAGEAKVIKTVRAETLKCMYGQQGIMLDKLIDDAVFHLQTHLLTHKTFAGYEPIFPSFYLGEVEELRATNINGLLKSEIQARASLGTVDMVDSPMEPEHHAEMRDSMTRRWKKSIKQLMLEQRATLKRNFDVRLDQRGIYKYDYVAGHYAANLSAINPARISTTMNANKRMLWDLMHAKNNEFTTINEVELLVYKPQFDGVNYSEKQIEQSNLCLEELTVEATKRDVIIKAMTSAQEAVERMIKHAA